MREKYREERLAVEPNFFESLERGKIGLLAELVHGKHRRERK